MDSSEHSANSLETEVSIETNKLFIDEINSLKKKSLSQLEILAIENNFSDIEKQIISDNTIFHVNKKIRLCNGYIDRKYGKHPKSCKSNICYKTALYYSLKNNCRLYLSIYKNLTHLQYAIPDLRKICTCCDLPIKDLKYKNLNHSINTIIDKLWLLDCECHQKYDFCKGYRENFLNFNQVNKIFNEESSYLLDQINVLFDYPCTKIENIQLEDYMYCLHKNIKHKRNMICRTNNEVINNKFDISKLIGDLLALEKMYQENVKIVILLFNQQAYELFKYALTTTYSEKKCISSFKSIYRKEDPYVDVNYRPKSMDLNITELTISKSKYSNLLKEIVSYGAHIDKIDVVINSLHKKNYEAFYQIIPAISKDNINLSFEGKYMSYDILTDLSISSEYKCKLLTQLFDYGYDINNKTYEQSPLEIIIQLKDSDSIVELIIKTLKNNKWVSLDKIIPHHITLAITNNKNSSLDNLLKTGTDVNLSDDSNECPLFTYLRLYDKLDSSIMNTILKYKPNLEIMDHNKYTPLLMASSYGDIKSIKVLLDYDINIFQKDQNENTALMIGLHNNYLIEALLTKNENGIYLINIQNNIGYTPLIASLYSKHPYSFISTIVNIDNVDFNLNDKQGKTVLDHLIEIESLSEKTKLKILDLLKDRVDCTIVPKNSNKPTLVRGIEKNAHFIVDKLFIHLVNLDKIEIIFQRQKIKKLNQSYKLNNIQVIPKFECHINYYSLVYNYLKTIYLSNTYKNQINDVGDVDNDDVINSTNTKIAMHVIMGTMLYIIVLLNSNYKKLNIQ